MQVAKQEHNKKVAPGALMYTNKQTMDTASISSDGLLQNDHAMDPMACTTCTNNTEVPTERAAEGSVVNLDLLKLHRSRSLTSPGFAKLLQRSLLDRFQDYDSFSQAKRMKAQQVCLLAHLLSIDWSRWNGHPA